MGLTNFPHGITSFGVPQIGGGVPATFGKYLFVDYDNGLDGNDGLSMDNPVKTIARAYALATTNANDVIILSAYSSHVLTAMLPITKNRVHFVGLDCGSRRYGQRSKITMGATTAATDVFMVKNTGIGNTFTNIKFSCSNTLTENVAAFGEGGEYTQFRNCEFYNSTDLDSDTTAEIVLNGDSTQFVNCNFGSLADAVSGDKIRPAVRTANGTVDAGKVCRDVLFEDCRFWKQAGGTTTAMVYIAASDDIERLMEFNSCQFIAAHLGSSPAVAIASAATLTKGQVIITGLSCAVHCSALATATGIIKCYPTITANASIGVQAS